MQKLVHRQLEVSTSSWKTHTTIGQAFLHHVILGEVSQNSHV